MRYSVLVLALNSLSLQYALANESTVNPNTEQHVNTKPIFHLSPIDVYVTPRTEVGKTYYSEEQIQQTANANKTISDFLRINPAVQFSQDSMAGGEQGELKASDISINGALAYDNKILLDNVSLNNSINPAGGEGEYAGIGGSSFATTVNTDLLCELEVLDSNVSAEYGEFTGGVIKAKTCAPKTVIGELHGQVNYDYTNSAWSRFNYVDDAERLLFDDNQSENYQQDFVKQGLSSSLYGRLSETLGFSLSASKRWSDIDYTSKLVNSDQSANQKRENQNVNLNLYAKLHPQHDLKIGLQYQNDKADLTQFHVKDSGRKIDEENKALELELKSRLANTLVTQSLVYQDQTKNNDGNTNESIGWNSSPAKNWSASNTASEGVTGDLQQSLDTLEYKVKSEWDAFKFGDTMHRITAGAGYGNYQADWRRLGDAYSYFKPSGKGLGIDSCLTASGERDAYCDESYNDGEGQYHIRRYLLTAGNVDVSQDRGYIFLEDKIDWKNTLKANIGVRADYDSLSKQTNVAPRTSFQYLPFSDDRLKLTTGWNRYFANNVFSYKLQDGTNRLSFNETRDSLDGEWTSTGYASNTNLERSQLDVPKTDETMFAISSRVGLFDAQLKYVHRDNKDQIKTRRIGFTPILDIYSNDGKSEADVYTFTLSNHTPITLGSSLNSFALGLDYTDVTRNFNSYEDSINPITYDPYILYDGRIIDEAERPANNFARPWTARLSVNTKFENIPLNIYNLFRYRSNYDAIVSSTIPKDERPEHNGYVLDTQYNETRMASAFNWDIRTTYDVKLAKDQLITLGLTVNNVLNKHNKYTESGEAKLKSEVGRQFIADISFKF